MGSNPVQAWIFQTFFHYCLSSVHNCGDRFHFHKFVSSLTTFLEKKNRIVSVSWREPFSVLFAPVISAAGHDFIHPKEYLRPVGDRFAGGLTLLNPIQTSGRNVRAETLMKRTCSWPRALVTDQSLRVNCLNHVMFIWVLKGKTSFIVLPSCFIGTTGSHLSLTQTCFGFTTLPTKC